MTAHYTPSKWLDDFCPEESCLTEEERILLVAPFPDEQVRKKSLLDIFFPDGNCEITSASQLP